ncbi:hypothetical protein CWE04_11360 [Thomasclavelia cocleata]|uniref:RNA ligase n=1 Tax=Thomasclavelia cocleata TaxID=69824 RepID=A0A1I0BGI7_9FIRM|nr:RNA ligase family protein [Thomasclavelia cocleata]MCR1959877.1 RNA ligase family protein [Thomasclavelia cocleata]NDO41777.1 hypothetical protein [Thomasclavelia cocleata]PJN79805.1 hypothetical protein CWE04_11360 [Thomasclavelia cocleata]SET05986.1 RNA ligase [Thomasclavelia cocleata]
MEFKKYQHIARLGTSETEGILNGKVFIQPKIDGTNASIWLNDDGTLGCGSRRRELTLFQDNQGFYNHYNKNENITNYLREHPNHRLFGEFLKPHSLKTYNDDAWDKFYVFDVCEDLGEDIRYLSFEEYSPLLDKYKIDYIPVINILENPTIDQIVKELNSNTYLIKEGMGYGEGIVIKNYQYVNKYGRKTWAKAIHSEYLNNSGKKSKAQLNEDTTSIETKISKKYVTEALVEKEYQKIINGDNFDPINDRKRLIPCLLSVLYHTIIDEEIWNIVQDYKKPTINFKVLQAEITNQIKLIKPSLFVKVAD